jgi:hypothetical protein
MSSTIAPAAVQVTLPEPFDPRWNRVPGLTIDGPTITLDTTEYFYRFTSLSWLICDWDTVARDLLPLDETPDTALEQFVLDYISRNSYTTTDPAQVLSTAWRVYSFLFREELLPVAGLDRIGPDELRALREAAVFMALNRVEMSGEISNVGPCWFAPAIAAAVFDFDEATAALLDEAFHGAWFNEARRIESVKAHAALGGRLVHGCQSNANLAGGACVPYGANIEHFRAELAQFRDEWLTAVHACRPTA